MICAAMKRTNAETHKHTDKQTDSFLPVIPQSRMAAAQFLLDLIEIRDNFRYSVSLLS